MRVPVISVDNMPLMPTKPSRARRWIKDGKAIGKFDKLGIFYVQLLAYPDSDSNKTSQRFIICQKNKPKKIIKEFYSLPKISDY